MYAEERQERIAAQLASLGRVAVVGLAQEFSVSSETIRRDLDQLEARGVLRRVHGGAVPASTISRTEESVTQRLDRNAAAKERIAVAAMDLVPSSFTGAILVDAGTTTSRLAHHLARWQPDDPRQTLVVITHSIVIAGIVSENPALEVHVVGGRLRGITSAAVGAGTIAQFSALRPDIAFIGANGLHAEFGLSTPQADEAAVKTALTQGARRAVALVDASKLGEETLVRFAGLDDIDTLITDDAPDDDLAQALDGAGVEVLVA